MPGETPLLPTEIQLEVIHDVTLPELIVELIFEEENLRRVWSALGVVFVALFVTCFALWFTPRILRYD